MCLNCLGDSEVKGEEARRLAEFYPNDRAWEFCVGDNHGAFTIVHPAE